MNVILSGTFLQAYQYACRQGWSMQDWRYAAGCHGVRGLRDYDLHRVGTWLTLPWRVIDEAERRAALCYDSPEDYQEVEAITYLRNRDSKPILPTNEP